MKASKTLPPPTLEKGQFWKTSEGDVEIMQVGKTLAHYRLFRDQRRAPTCMGGIEMVQAYLKKNKGRLVANPNLVKPIKKAS